MIKDSFLFQTYSNIKHKLPDYVMGSMKKLIPAYFISSVFEIFGLVILFPVINVIIDPSNIDKSFFLKFIYEKLKFGNTITFVLFLLCIITITFILKNILLFFLYKIQTNVAFNLTAKIAFEKYISYLNKPYQFHVENNSALLLRNFVQIPTELIIYYVLPFFNILNELFMLFLIVAGTILYDPLLFTSIFLFSIPFLFFYDRVYKQKLKTISEQRELTHSGMYKTGMQSMEGFREITVFNKKDFFKSTFEQQLKNFTKAAGDLYLLNSFSPKIVEIAAMITIFCIFLFGYLFDKNMSALAQFLIIFAIAAYRIIPSINKLILSFNYIKSYSYVFEHFEKSDFDFQSQDIKKKEQAQPLSFQKEIDIQNLSFKFPTQKEFVLKNINIKISKSKTIGIVGPSGSGKTTLLNILLRLYQEQEGGIFIDDVKINKDNLAQWYKIVSYVPQNTILLDGTIAENIAFGIENNKVDIKLLEDVMEKSLLKEFINSLSDGINTSIGEKGIKISGGQRQRIGIARALYHGGEILIFDEATSALDYETENMLTESIDNLSHKTDLTVIIVAHRIQTLKYCHAVYKLQKGVLSPPLTYDQHINS